jgi:hypothetical protein
MDMTVKKSSETQTQYLPQQFDRTDTVYESAPIREFEFVGRISRQMRQLVEMMPTGKAVIAGASLADLYNGIPTKDIDVFFFDPAAQAEMVGFMKKNGYQPAEFFTPGCQNFKGPGEHDVPVQLVGFRTYDDAAHVLDGFDFTVCQLATDGTRLWRGPTTFQDVREQLLNFHRIESEGKVVVERVARYLDKGYRLTSQSFKLFAEKVAGIEV